MTTNEKFEMSLKVTETRIETYEHSIHLHPDDNTLVRSVLGYYREYRMKTRVRELYNNGYDLDESTILEGMGYCIDDQEDDANEIREFVKYLQ